MSLPEGHSSEGSEAEGRGCSQRKRYPRVGLTHCWWLGKNMGTRIIFLIVREATKYKSALIWPSRPMLYLGNMSGVHSLLPHCSGFRTHFLLPVSPPSCWLVFLPKTEFDHVTYFPNTQMSCLLTDRPVHEQAFWLSRTWPPFLSRCPHILIAPTQVTHSSNIRCSRHHISPPCYISPPSAEHCLPWITTFCAHS